MIKLKAMHMPRVTVLICLIIPLAIFTPVYAQSPVEKPVVISPRGGEALQGRVEINGITALANFQRAEIEFRYTNDPKNTWFFIAETDQPVNPGKIAEWDTSIVTDGDYDLRITVFSGDGSSQSVMVSGIRVRNYSHVETPTPAAAEAVSEYQSATATIFPTRTPLPTRPSFTANPAELTRSDLTNSLLRGSIAGLGFFLAFAIYWIVKKSLS
ncbi:MAG: hypothetical protein GYA15_11700 [Leptolinea sp.]|jgi:hypothetical protein|nr:hypothetical protein [Leptolinea sp.]